MVPEWCLFHSKTVLSRYACTSRPKLKRSFVSVIVAILQDIVMNKIWLYLFIFHEVILIIIIHFCKHRAYYFRNEARFYTYIRECHGESHSVGRTLRLLNASLKSSINFFTRKSISKLKECEISLFYNTVRLWESLLGENSLVRFFSPKILS